MAILRAWIFLQKRAAVGQMVEQPAIADGLLEPAGRGAGRIRHAFVARQRETAHQHRNALALRDAAQPARLHTREREIVAKGAVRLRREPAAARLEPRARDRRLFLGPAVPVRQGIGRDPRRQILPLDRPGQVA